MKNLLLLFLIYFTGSDMIFDFEKESNISRWKVEDDVVMGGRSQGYFDLSKEGYGMFYGNVSLENNGGFSSVHYVTDQMDCSDFSQFVIRLKGDGKKYQFRVKAERSDRHSYVYEFETSGDWETVAIPFDKMYASWRGRTLDLPNFQGQQAYDFAFLIGNKKPQEFKLLIDRISMK